MDQASQNYSQDTLVRGSWSTAAEKPKVPNKVFHTQHVVHFLLPETVRREKEDTVTQLQCKMTSHLETEGAMPTLRKIATACYASRAFLKRIFSALDIKPQRWGLELIEFF